MATDTPSERKQATKTAHVGAPPAEPEQLPCPRCSSTNTKFCYYNNYNFSQPRHFCKACRRYWTHGGTLRDIPVGGGSRKNAKRSRTSTISSNTTSSTTSSGPAHVFSSSPLHHHDFRHLPLVPFAGDHHGGGLPFVTESKMCGSFTSLLSTTTNPGTTGIFAFGGFGLGIGPGFEDVGFGLGKAAWPLGGVVEGGLNVGGSGFSGHTWQMENSDGGFVGGGGGGGECFAMPPDLAISTPGSMLK